jgi:REP element-mobilizing transposase RayT
MRGRLSYASETLYFVTTTVANHSRVFVKDKYCDILINNIKHYQRRHQFRILGYAIMPSHFHWVVNVDPELGLVSDVMRDIKKYTAWEIMADFPPHGRSPFRATLSAQADEVFVGMNADLPTAKQRPSHRRRREHWMIKNENSGSSDSMTR